MWVILYRFGRELIAVVQHLQHRLQAAHAPERRHLDARRSLDLIYISSGVKEWKTAESGTLLAVIYLKDVKVHLFVRMIWLLVY